jgi:small conductance mechanosensitive channel
MDKHKFDELLDKLIVLSQEWGLKLLYAVIVLFVGLWIIKKITNASKNALTNRKFEPSLITFFVSFGNIILKVVLVISIVEILGIELTSLTVILGAAGLAVGMALSGTLQNFAGSVMLLMFKPFKVGDFIEAKGYMGVVKEIQIFNTILVTVDNRMVIIPNGGLATDSMINYSAEPTRRVDLVIGISYNDDIDKAREIALKTLAEDKRILKKPESFVGVLELGDSSVNLAIRPWVKTKDYWDVFFATQESIKKAFDRNGISIPFPQRDVHLISESK